MAFTADTSDNWHADEPEQETKNGSDKVEDEEGQKQTFYDGACSKLLRNGLTYTWSICPVESSNWMRTRLNGFRGAGAVVPSMVTIIVIIQNGKKISLMIIL